MDLDRIDRYLTVLWYAQPLFQPPAITYPVQDNDIARVLNQARREVANDLGFFKSIQHAAVLQDASRFFHKSLTGPKSRVPYATWRQLRVAILTVATVTFNQLEEKSYGFSERDEIRRIYHDIFFNIESAIYPDDQDVEGVNGELRYLWDRLVEKDKALCR